MTGETKKPKPLTPKPMDEGLREAPVDSEWYCALWRQDCKALMALLEANPCLVAQTGRDEWTVLHSVAHRGCIQLLGQIFYLFKHESHFVDKRSGVRISWIELRGAECGMFQAKAHHMAWFTCPKQVWKVLIAVSSSIIQRISWILQCNPDAFQHLRDKVVEIMQGETSKKAFESLENGYHFDKNYNFVLERQELQFHYACNNLGFRKAAKEYVKTIIGGCLDLGPSESVEVLTYLFQLHNAQGQTPLHLTSKHGIILKLVELLPHGDAYKGCLNAKDVRGWTALHYLATTNKGHENLKALLQDERVDVNAKTSPGRRDDKSPDAGKTALHLAILHNDVESVEHLLKCPRTDVGALFNRYIQCGYETERPSEDREEIRKKRSYWSPLQLAAIMGLSDVVRALLRSKLCDIYNDEKLESNTIMEENFQRVSALLFASASGNPNTLRLFLDNPMFNPLAKFQGATALHYAAYAMTPSYIHPMYDRVGPFLLFMDLGKLDLHNCRYEEPKHIEMTPRSYLGRQACVTMLLQVGVDIWEKDNQGRFADPGPRAPKEAQLWWHEKMAQETLEAKKSLNDAANAIAVVAALVATASFVGPLQPPLGYGGDSIEDGVQDNHLSVRVFMVSNNLSFYLAIASILFAVVPSLPMPQEGIYVEWQRTKRTVAMAIFFLLMSVLGVLISFGAASNSVVSEEYSWRHDGLLFYPTLLGGFICILGISLFFLRLLRLVFNRNAKIRYLYKTFVRF